MKKLVPLFLIILAVVVSGCVQSPNNTTGNPTQSNALSIAGFNINPATTQSNQDVYLEVNVKNIGDQNAKDTKIRIYNPPFGQCVECWKIRNNNPSCSTLGNQWACLGDLHPKDVSAGIEGEEKTAYWNMRAPVVPSGSEMAYDFYARAYYGYETIATTQLVLINRAEENSNEKKPPKTQNSKGPIRFFVTTKSPIVVSSGQDMIRFCIKAKNIGKGTVYAEGTPADSIQSEDLNLIHVSIVFGGLDQVAEHNILLNQTYCTTFYPNTVSIRKTVPVTITGTYNYYEDTKTTAIVKSY